MDYVKALDAKIKELEAQGIRVEIYTDPVKVEYKDGKLIASTETGMRLTRILHRERRIKPEALPGDVGSKAHDGSEIIE